MLSDPEITEGLEEAFARFLAIYSDRGAHHFHGWDHADDSHNNYGPMLWSEADCALRLAWELERQFPGMVQLEVPVASWTFADYDSKVDRRQFVDVVVSDLEDFVEDHTSQERFRAHRHMLFVEAKYLPAGCSKTWRHVHIRKIHAVLCDAERLSAHVARGHCAVGAVFVVDDDGLFEENAPSVEWPGDVIRLVASPAELRRRGTHG